jgi:hypothetical protein
MLENNITQQSDSIEKIFCEPFSELPIRSLTRDEAILLATVTTIEMDSLSIKFKDLKEEDIPTSILLMQKSLRTRFNFEMSESLQIMISSICESVGLVVMYLTYLQFQSKKRNKKKLNISDFGEIFPNGIPTDESLHKLWLSQKIKKVKSNINGSNNLLDYQSALQSIILK